MRTHEGPRWPSIIAVGARSHPRPGADLGHRLAGRAGTNGCAGYAALVCIVASASHTIYPDRTIQSLLLLLAYGMAGAAAAQCARIGVAKAAFFPVVRLTASGGYLSGEVEDLFNWESRVWSIGPSISLPIFAGGRNLANYRRSQSAYDEAVAKYRQQILVAFGEVENSLALASGLTV